jgi:phosphate/sulfate permease
VRILVVGNGAREDALSWRLAQSPSCDAIFAAPGNAGTASRGEIWNVAATDGKALVEKCREAHIDFVVIGPETAIAAGVGDRLREAGISAFGPNRSSGRLESSKVFAKRFMERHGVPTARAAIVHSLDGATKFIPTWVKIAVAIALGLGTMIGWKRIVVTVGEKIGKTHLTYAQGACAEITAAATIAAADGYGLPVSTTHVLSSGIAGTMSANGSGLQWATVRNIALAWLLTLPIAMMISGTLYWSFSRLF